MYMYECRLQNLEERKYVFITGSKRSPVTYSTCTMTWTDDTYNRWYTDNWLTPAMRCYMRERE